MGIKDGVGASTFAFQLALTLKAKRQNVLLLDGDSEYLGDLKTVSEENLAWRSVADLEKIPKPIQPDWLFGYLKGPQGLSCLGLAQDRAKLGDLNPHFALNEIEKIAPFFDWVIADIGSRWDSFNSACLTKTDLLLFVMNSRISLVHEFKRKLEELLMSYFPTKRLGWVANRWDPKSFLSVQSVADFVSISYFGETPQVCYSKLQGLTASNGDLNAFIPAALFPKTEASFQNRPQLLSADAKDISRDLKVRWLKRIQEKMEAKGIKAEAKEEGLRDKISKIILEVLEEESSETPSDLDRTALTKDFLDELLGLGPLEKLLSLPGLGEILVNGTKPIYVEEKGQLKETTHQFLNEEALQKVIERILMPLGRRVDESSPMVDARLKDGSRVNIIIPPLSLDGPAISIRRFSKRVLDPAALVSFGSATESMMEFLKTGVQNKLNILVSGGTGSGKTTLLNILSSFIQKEERIVTIEDAAELSLNQPHVVRLESRPPNIEGKGGIGIRDLVRNALRMRPDRIIVGECRGAEALDMLQAMNTGHDGSLTTLHANTPRDALSRLETLVMFAGMDLPSKAIREQIASAVDLIVQIARLSDGARKIISIVKVVGMEGDVFTLQDIFKYEDQKFLEL